MSCLDPNSADISLQTMRRKWYYEPATQLMSFQTKVTQMTNNMQFQPSGGKSGAPSCKYYGIYICIFSDVEVKPIEDLKIKMHSTEKDTKESSDYVSNLPGDEEGLEPPTPFDLSPKALDLKALRSGSYSSINKPNPNMERPVDRSKRKRKIITLQKLMDKPGKIFNKNLMYFDEDAKLKLRTDIVEGKDYFLVDSQSWNYFKKWYG